MRYCNICTSVVFDNDVRQGHVAMEILVRWTESFISRVWKLSPVPQHVESVMMIRKRNQKGAACWRHATLWSFATLCFCNSAWTRVPSLVFEAPEAALVAPACIWAKHTPFVNSNATLFQHVFKRNVQDVYFHLSLLLPDDNTSSVRIDATPAATGGRCRAELDPQRRLFVTHSIVVSSGRLHRDIGWSACLFLIILCVNWMNWDQKRALSWCCTYQRDMLW